MKMHIEAGGRKVTIDVEAAEMAHLSAAEAWLHQHIFPPLDQTPGWPTLQAQVQQLDERTKLIMSGLDRITASVANVGAAVGGLADEVTQVGEALKAHPATSDDAQLSALADQLDNIAAQMTASAADLKQTVDVVNSEAAQAGTTTDAGATTDTTGGADAGAGTTDTSGTDTSAQPAA